MTHEDKARGLFFHPVLLEKMHKSGGSYTFDDYVDEVRKLYGIEMDAEAWSLVSGGSLKKSDKKYGVYLGLCKSGEDKAMACTTEPPRLEVAFRQETWLMPSAKHPDYNLKMSFPGTKGPWWAGFAPHSEVAGEAIRGEACTRRLSDENSISSRAVERESLRPYGIPVSSEPIPGALASPNGRSAVPGIALPTPEGIDSSQPPSRGPGTPSLPEIQETKPPSAVTPRAIVAAMAMPCASHDPLPSVSGVSLCSQQASGGSKRPSGLVAWLRRGISALMWYGRSAVVVRRRSHGSAVAI